MTGDADNDSIIGGQGNDFHGSAAVTVMTSCWATMAIDRWQRGHPQ